MLGVWNGWSATTVSYMKDNYTLLNKRNSFSSLYSCTEQYDHMLTLKTKEQRYP